MTVFWMIVGILGIGGFAALMWNYHRQVEYKDEPPGIVPEDYE